MTLNELIAQKACELDNLILLRTILESGDCNVCRKRKICVYVPGFGEQVRYNCPFFEKKENAEHEN